MTSGIRFRKRTAYPWPTRKTPASAHACFLSRHHISKAGRSVQQWGLHLLEGPAIRTRDPYQGLLRAASIPRTHARDYRRTWAARGTRIGAGVALAAALRHTRRAGESVEAGATASRLKPATPSLKFAGKLSPPDPERSLQPTSPCVCRHRTAVSIAPCQQVPRSMPLPCSSTVFR